MQYIVVEIISGKIMESASRPDDGYTPIPPAGCTLVMDVTANVRNQYYDFTEQVVVDMPNKPSGVATFNYNTKQWDVDVAESIRTARANEYPPIGDQLDALWKLIKANADKIDLVEALPLFEAVQAVKDKYPKTS